MKRLRGRHAAAALLALVTVATAACADKGAPSAGASDTPSVILSDIAGPTTAPTTAAPPAPPPPPVEDLPASWKLCQNPLRGSSMGYPGEWHTTSLGPGDACSMFHPDPFTIVPNSEGPLVALHAYQSQSTAAQTLAGFTDPEHYTTILSEPTTAVGRPAHRFEVVSLGVAMIAAGTRFYGYIIDRSGKAFTLYTVAAAGEIRYNNWKFVVDTAKGTLKFDH
jgi:hypothetical protein